jgi:hypothetical protein
VWGWKYDVATREQDSLTSRGQEMDSMSDKLCKIPSNATLNVVHELEDRNLTFLFLSDQ